MPSFRRESRGDSRSRFDRRPFHSTGLPVNHTSISDPQQSRLLSLDLLRAFAAIGVFVFHASSTAGFDKFKLPITSPLSGAQYTIPNFFSLGATGVSLFFVVSGYCLTTSWFNEARRINAGGYYLRRFSRVYPAYFFSLLVTLLSWLLLDGWGAMLTPYSDGRPSLGADLVVHAFFLQGFSTRSFLSFNGTLWSMATEVQFYVLLPVIYAFMSRYGYRATVVLTCVFCLFVRYVSELSMDLVAPVEGGVSYSVLISYSSLGRLLEFVVGMAIASAEVKERGRLKIRLSCVILLLFVPALLRWRGAGWIADPAWGIGFGALLVWMLGRVEADKLTLLNDFAWVRWLQKFGLYSYSFFLIHWAVLLLSGRLVWDSGSGGWSRMLVEGTSCFAVSFVVARWMYFNVEMRKFQFAHYFR